MGYVTYTESLSNGVNVSSGSLRTLSGSPLPSGAVITGIQYSVRLSASRYSSSKDWVLDALAVGGSGGSPYTSSVYVPMSSGDYTFTGNLNFDASDALEFKSSAINVYLMAYTTHDAQSYYWGMTITVHYEVYTNTEPPTTLTLSSTSVAPGARVTLSWSGARAGDANAITGYRIYRATSASGAFSQLTTVSSTKTSGTATVTAPSTNGASYYYKVQTLGSVSGYDSTQSEATATLTCSYATVGAPTALKIDVTNVAPGAEAMLSWSGATAGDNNAIKGYDVYRATSSAGDYVWLATVNSTATSASVKVTAPTASGTAYYYKVRTLGTLTNGHSPLSDTYTSLACTYSAPTAPTSVTLAGASATYVLPGSAVRLAWSGASAGANNAIKGYDVYRDGALLTSLAATASGCNVTPTAEAGHSNSFTVVTRGEYSDSAPSETCTLYVYTDPTAPTELRVSQDVAPAGSRVLLSWSGAAPGGYNDIKGYRVYRSTAEAGTYAQVAMVDSTDTAQSCYVAAPSTVGDYYYFKVETVGAYSTSGLPEESIAVGAREATEDEEGSVEVIVPPAQQRKKRGLLLGDYDTAAHGWTLNAWSFPEPDPQTHYIEVPGRAAGPLDQSEFLTPGDPRYISRELSIRLECSNGTRLERDDLIHDMVNRLHGRREEIVFPDDPTRYAVGRLTVKTEYSDPAHCAVNISGTCEPWRYSKQETRVTITAAEEEKTVVLANAGRRVQVPVIEVTGFGADVRLACNGRTWDLGAGAYKLPELTLSSGNTVLTYSGYGNISFTYREAVL